MEGRYEMEFVLDGLPFYLRFRHLSIVELSLLLYQKAVLSAVGMCSEHLFDLNFSSYL